MSKLIRVAVTGAAGRVASSLIVRLASGGLDPMQAYFKRRLQLSGDIMLAAKLTALFRIPKAARRTGAGPRS